MLRNYLRVAIRNLLRHKFYTVVNVIGLTIGLTASILLVIYLRYEFSFDQHHVNKDRIYRVIRQASLTSDKAVFGPETSGALSPALKAEIPEVEASVRVLNRGYLFTAGDRSMTALGCIAEPDYLDIFTYELVVGNRAALLEPGTAAISEYLAATLFGESDPIGQVVHANYKWFDTDYKVVAILKNHDRNKRSINELQYSFLTVHPPRDKPGRDVLERMYTEWRGDNTFRPLFTWVMLREGADPDVVEAKMRGLMERHMGPEIATRDAYFLQPLGDIYLRSLADYNVGRFGYGDIRMVWNLTLAALFILVIACANFVNLSTARASARAREVGMRKVSGAFRGQLIAQFLGEAVLIAALALVFALAAVYLLIPTFGEYVGRRLPEHPEVQVLIAALAVTGLTGLLAGLYPALVLSGFQPTQVLKGSVGGGRGDVLRRVLVVLQVAVSVFLVILTTVVENQARFVREKDLGFQKEHILMSSFFQFRPDLVKSYRSIKEEFLSIPGVEKVAGCTNPPGFENRADRAMFYPTGGATEGVEMAFIGVDEDFIDVFGLELVAGRNFTGIEPPNDSQLILNETAVKRLGWQDDPIGRPLDEAREGRVSEPVIGVVKDFHNGPLQEPIGPVALYVRKPQVLQLSKMALKIESDSIKATLEAVEATWKKYIPNRPFWHWFLDLSIDFQYRETDRLIRVFSVSSMLGILIASLGLLGVVSYTTHQRTREIGIRRTLGASNAGLLALIYEGPLKLSLTGVVMVSPVAWYVASRWLEDFAYRTTIGPWPFALGAGIAIAMGAVSVGLEGLRATRLEPVEALREE